MKNTKVQGALRQIFRRLDIKITAGVMLLSAMVSGQAAVFVVTTLADSGTGSLRDQVVSSSAGDTIRFAVSGTIVLSSSINISHIYRFPTPHQSIIRPAMAAIDLFKQCHYDL